MLNSVLDLIAPAGLLIYGFLNLKKADTSKLTKTISNFVIIVSLSLFCYKLQNLLNLLMLETIFKEAFLNYLILSVIFLIVSFVMMVKSLVVLIQNRNNWG